jgi:hypothetical protein
MTKDEALKLALEALISCRNLLEIEVNRAIARDAADAWIQEKEAELHQHNNAITAIKAALEAKDEPVAWLYPDDLKRFETSETFAQAYSIEVVSPTHGETVPLYTTPPQRKPLTRQQINQMMADAGWQNSAIRQADLDKVEKFAKALEAAHGIKGEA